MPDTIHEAYDKASQEQGISISEFAEFDTLDAAIAYTLDNPKGSDAALTREQAIEFLKRYRGQFDKGAPVMLMHETESDDWQALTECPHCPAACDSGTETRCSSCGLGLNVLQFTDVQDGDMEEDETPEEFAEAWEWFRLWPRETAQTAAPEPKRGMTLGQLRDRFQAPTAKLYTPDLLPIVSAHADFADNTLTLRDSDAKGEAITLARLITLAGGWPELRLETPDGLPIVEGAYAPSDNTLVLSDKLLGEDEDDAEEAECDNIGAGLTCIQRVRGHYCQKCADKVDAITKRLEDAVKDALDVFADDETPMHRILSNLYIQIQNL